MAEVKARNYHKKRIETIRDKVKYPTTALMKTDVEVYEKQLREHFVKAEEYHITILGTCTDTKAEDTQEAEFVAINGAFLEALKKMEELKVTFITPGSSTPVTSTTGISLPKMSLPNFQGTYEGWPEFKDLFTANIRTHASLTASQKLQYLKSCVKGEAGKLIASLTITDTNYLVAWNALESRYDNKREIVSSIIKKLCNQQQLKSDSATATQQLHDTTMDCIRQLRVLGRPVDTWDDLLCEIVLSKFDANTKAEWARTLTGTDPPTFKEVEDFLEKQIRILLARGNQQPKSTGNQQEPKSKQNNQNYKSHQISTSQQTCRICNDAHAVYTCATFRGMSAQDRYQACVRTRTCTNCLNGSHWFRECTGSSCRTCNKRHHTLLHDHFTHQSTQKNPAVTTNQSSRSTQQVAETTTSLHSTPNSKSSGGNQVIFKTAMAHIKDGRGNNHLCRVLIDDASQCSFMSKTFARTIGLRGTRSDVGITGIGETAAAQSKWTVSFSLYSRVYDAKVDVEAPLLNKVTGTIPPASFATISWPHLEDLQLADPQYNHPGEIDVLLGLDVISDILLQGLIKGPRLSPTAQHTIFGWVLMGKVNNHPQKIIKVHHSTCSTDELIQKFWEVERVPHAKPQTQEERACEIHFDSTHHRNLEGRFMVRIPFNGKQSSIGESRELATRRLLQLERRFRRHPTHHEGYKAFMKEYLELGHMELAPKVRQTNSIPYYIPHHFVLKDDSTTTKLRVVFDASMKSTTGVSLNDTMMVGPTVQDDLITLLLRFRTKNVALKADVAKMYRQFEIHPDDRDYQQILWRENEEDDIKEYRLKTVTYGTACAPFLATRCLKQLATDEKEKYPAAATAVESSMYVDDLLGGEETDEAAVKLYHELNQLCKAGGLTIRKWCSSSKEVLKHIPPEDQEIDSHSFDEGPTVKALGVRWQPNGDYFHFAYNPLNRNAITKREILSQILSTFDPVGLISPVIITAKILMQDLWRANLDWNDQVPEQLLNRWHIYCDNLQSITNLKIPRLVVKPNPTSIQLHGFSDASENAYAACVYVRSEYGDGSIMSHLYTARTKVAPLQQLTLPRLELCGAHLLADIFIIVKPEISPDATVFAWTDSTITLQWITHPSRNWKTYVANRVSAIQESLPPTVWQHVKGEENPADLPSRGVTPDDLYNNAFWWHGPSWLLSREFPVNPTFPTAKDTDEIEKEEKAVISHATAVNQLPSSTTGLLKSQNLVITALHNNQAQPESIIEKLCNFSSLPKMVNAMVWLNRFLNSRFKQLPISSHLIAKRLQAFHTIIRLVQAEKFTSEVQQLKTGKAIFLKSKLASLNPYLDNNQIIRVGGRISCAQIQKSQIHPIILPGEHHFTEVLIRDFHQTYLHGGHQLIKTIVQRQYFIVGGRNPIKRIIKSCVTCRKVKATTMEQQMGNLPSSRVTPNRPFLHAGVDFCGPFHIKTRSGRGAKVEKFYIAVFVCFTTKACHLEPVSSLSTDAFIAAYKRFTSRRGVCSHVHSDCGTNFVGANREFERLLRDDQDKMLQQLGHHAPTWDFHPPASPHRNGLTEAAVKSAKYHLKRVVGEERLTYEQFLTLLCSIEACLNSRPLSPLSSDPASLDVLTPGHFLIGEPLTSIPEPNLTLENANRLDQWRRMQQLTQILWTRWKDEYLTTLQRRTKWQRPQPNLQKDDLVIIKDESIAPTKWKLGRVISTEKSADGLVRKATLQTATGITTRAIQKLSLLLSHNSSQ